MPFGLANIVRHDVSASTSTASSLYIVGNSAVFVLTASSFPVLPMSVGIPDIFSTLPLITSPTVEFLLYLLKSV